MALLNKQTVLEHLCKRLIETANNNVGFECDAGVVFEEIAKDRIKTWLDEVQSVDAVPVIRCKDCENHRDRINMCDIWHRHTSREGYCHRAKAKSKEQNANSKTQ